ncbi:GAD domain-containing protein, partial [Bacillus sp. D-CC]
VSPISNHGIQKTTCEKMLPVKVYGAKGLAWLKVEEDGLKGPIAKFFGEEDANVLMTTLEATAGDLLLFVADKKSVVA